MARATTTRHKTVTSIVAWTVALVIFFPILWIFVLSFKSEGDAIKTPLEVLTSAWTIDSYAVVQDRSDYFKHFFNSVIVAVGSTLLGILVAVPAAWSMAFVPSKRTKNGILMWMLSTKMLPAVGVLIRSISCSSSWPSRQPHRPCHRSDADQPADHRLDALHLFSEIPAKSSKRRGWTAPACVTNLYVLTPMAVPGIASTMLLNVILAWNEAFWTLNLTAAKAAPLTAFIASYSSPEGLFTQSSARRR